MMGLYDKYIRKVFEFCNESAGYEIASAISTTRRR